MKKCSGLYRLNNFMIEALTTTSSKTNHLAAIVLPADAVDVNVSTSRMIPSWGGRVARWSTSS